VLDAVAAGPDLALVGDALVDPALAPPAPSGRYGHALIDIGRQLTKILHLDLDLMADAAEKTLAQWRLRGINEHDVEVDLTRSQVQQRGTEQRAGGGRLQFTVDFLQELALMLPPGIVFRPVRLRV
jgi:hypothetical protein